MKKARIILSAVALFAVVGGAFAFKAYRGSVIFTNTTTTLPCTIPVLNRTLTTGTNTALLIPASTTTAGAFCPQTYTTVSL